jgi:serine/threonine protein kinase
MTAEGLGDLFDLLLELRGLVIEDRFVLQSLYGFGGHGYLWLTDDRLNAEQPVLTRLAALPYHRPAYMTDADIVRARSRLEREAQLLARFGGDGQRGLPKMIALCRGPNPLHLSERGTSITQTEPYLVMEWIPGPTLAERRVELASGLPATWPDLLTLARLTTTALIDLSRTLLPQGYLYADVTPRNLLCQELAGGVAVRVVDPGGIVPVGPAQNVELPCTWGYLPPEHYAAHQAGERVWPSEASVMHALGRTLWHVLTGRHPVPGEDVDLGDSALKECPEAIVAFVDALLAGRFARRNGVGSN